jgi:hypothetical protein
MEDEIAPKEELLEHTEDAGDKAVSRLEDLMKTLTDSVTTLANNTSTIATHVAELKAHQAAQDTAHTARETVNDALDTTGEAGGTVVKAVDVPLATTEDVIHDAGEVPKVAEKATEEVVEPAKKRRKFGRKRR